MKVVEEPSRMRSGAVMIATFLMKLDLGLEKFFVEKDLIVESLLDLLGQE